MNKKFFKKHKSLGYDGGYWATFAVVSDGDIAVDPDWKEAEEILNPEWIVYQCCNPEVCVKECLRKQEMADTLREQLEEIKAEQSILKRLLGSKLPIDQPVLFGDIVAVTDEDGVVLFQKAILPSEL